jgi:hypothetical protein
MKRSGWRGSSETRWRAVNKKGEAAHGPTVRPRQRKVVRLGKTYSHRARLTGWEVT